MYEIDKDKARKILIEEEHYQPEDADLTLKDYPLLREPLDQVVKGWLENRTIMDLKVDGLDLADVMKVRSMPLLEAVRSLNILLDSSISLEDREAMHRALSRPVKIR